MRKPIHHGYHELLEKSW